MAAVFSLLYNVRVITGEHAQNAAKEMVWITFLATDCGNSGSLFPESYDRLNG